MLRVGHWQPPGGGPPAGFKLPVGALAVPVPVPLPVPVPVAAQAGASGVAGNLGGTGCGCQWRTWQ